MSNTLATPLTPEEQTIVDRAQIQGAFKQGFNMAANGANALDATIKQVEARNASASADLITEARALLDSLKSTLDSLRTQSGIQ